MGTRGKCAQQFSYGFKSLVKLGVPKKIFKITARRTVFRKSTPNLTITNGDFESNFEVLKKKIKKPLKVPSLARSVPKPLKVPSLARSVPKPLSIFGRSRRAPAVVTAIAVDPLPAGRRQRGTRTDSPKLIVESESESEKVKSEVMIL